MFQVGNQKIAQTIRGRQVTTVLTEKGEIILKLTGQMTEEHYKDLSDACSELKREDATVAAMDYHDSALAGQLPG